ncbi:hypothetical protein GQX73_g4411 [Xylaria multiplex]|uniref:Agglutinin domain-containing protein n=1 Tax=Xylaria multiplex TaxID=323545 RepID=A0A7C8IPR0_9PEZI|nr:hypothetical protein GQX73_g4411 [Xylaria multiplex]
MSTHNLPPPEVAVRLLGLSSNHVLFSRESPDPTFWHFSNNGGIYDDQWWYLIPGTGSHKGDFLVKSKCTNKVIFSRASPDPTVGHIDGNGKYADNWFWLEFGTGDRKNYFRLRNRESDLVLVSRTTRDPQVCNFSGKGDKYNDQYFSFLCEHVDFDSIKYHLNDATILSSVTVAMGSLVDINKTDVKQSMDFTFAKAESLSYTWDYTVAFTVGVKTEAEVEIPFVASGKVEVNASNTHSFSSAQTTSSVTTFSGTVNVMAPPQSKVTATATMTRSEISVPFTMYLKVASTNKPVTVDGVYKGTSFWNLTAEFNEQKL